MTELCSQRYDATSRLIPTTMRHRVVQVKITPPWMLAAAVNPVSLKAVAPGEIGMLRFFGFGQRRFRHPRFSPRISGS